MNESKPAVDVAKLDSEKDWLNEVISESTSVNRKQHLMEEDMLKIIIGRSNGRSRNSFFNKMSTNTKPTGYWAYRTRFYSSRHSEGNRFITNDEL
jgi:hypothetical protein